jgi:hydrogenase maturation protease
MMSGAMPIMRSNEKIDGMVPNTEPLDISPSGAVSHRHASPNGLALVSFGNPLRGDDGVAAAVCNSVIHEYRDLACYFELEGAGYHLPDILAGHQSAVIVDATSSNLSPGALTILELPLLIKNNKVLPAVCHGISWFDELRLAANRHRLLPDSITFFGIEAGDSNWGCTLSPTLRALLPGLSEILASLLFMKAEERLCTKQP